MDQPANLGLIRGRLTNDEPGATWKDVDCTGSLKERTMNNAPARPTIAEQLILDAQLSERNACLNDIAETIRTQPAWSPEVFALRAAQDRIRERAKAQNKSVCTCSACQPDDGYEENCPLHGRVAKPEAWKHGYGATT